MQIEKKGYRPKSLEGRDNYGLSPEQLAEYLKKRRGYVPRTLVEIVEFRRAVKACFDIEAAA